MVDQTKPEWIFETQEDAEAMAVAEREAGNHAEVRQLPDRWGVWTDAWEKWVQQ